MPDRLRIGGRGVRAVLVAAVLLASTATVGSAYPDPDKAGYGFDSPCFAAHDRRFVFDFVGLLDRIEGEWVEQEACRLYAEDGAHFVLVVVPGLDGETLDNYAFHLFESWGVGDDERLDGLMLLYVMDDGSGSGAGRVEVGYGLEQVITGIHARDAIDAIARIKAERTAAGLDDRDATSHALSAGAAGLANFTRQSYEGVEPQASGDGEPDGVFLLGFLGLILVLAVLAFAVRRGGFGGGRGGLGGSGGFSGGRYGGGPGGWGGSGRGGWGGGGGGGRRGGGGFGGGRSGGGGWGGKF